MRIETQFLGITLEDPNELWNEPKRKFPEWVPPPQLGDDEAVALMTDNTGTCCAEKSFRIFVILWKLLATEIAVFYTITVLYHCLCCTLRLKQYMVPVNIVTNHFYCTPQ